MQNKKVVITDDNGHVIYENNGRIEAVAFETGEEVESLISNGVTEVHILIRD